MEIFILLIMLIINKAEFQQEFLNKNNKKILKAPSPINFYQTEKKISMKLIS